MRKAMRAPLLVGFLLTLACAGVQAQGVYRIVGPDGKVTFSDRPPADANAQPARIASEAPSAANGALPYELRQIANRFPVTLYTGNDCPPCTSARNLLTSRGVPFTERTVSSNEDIAALQRLSGGTGLPFGTIGGQQLAGFSEGEWTQYLDAAGYPKQSVLPRNYRQPAPTPLVAVKAVEPAAAPAASAPAVAPAPSRARPRHRSTTDRRPATPPGSVFRQS